MKLNVLVLLSGAILFFSCNKEAAMQSDKQIKEDGGCIERLIIPHTQYNVDSSQLAIINQLFINNGIPVNTFRYYGFSEDSVQTYYPPFAKFDDKNVRADQYANGIRIFNDDLLFNFENEVLNYQGGTFTKGTSLDTVPKLALAQLRTMFLNDAERFDRRGIEYKDTCLKAEFGYYNLNAGISYAEENLIKAWKVTLENSFSPSEYPVAYYQDDNGSLIYYNDGIETFRACLKIKFSITIIDFKHSTVPNFALKRWSKQR